MMAVRRILLGSALALALAPMGLPAADDQKGFDAPEGVTLQAKAGGRYLLLWDPIDSESLMGYSVWLRRKGEKEFVRLTVPVKVGKEVQKQPMVNEAKLELKLGENRKDLEFAVVSEYEDGPSARSASVFSARARVASGAAVAAVVPAAELPGGPALATGTSPTTEATGEGVALKKDPYAGEDDKAAPEGPAPWTERSKLSKRTLLEVPGHWRTGLSVSFELNRFMAKGKDAFSYTGLILSNSPFAQDQVVTWKRTDIRTRVRVPLRVKLGLLPGLEAWAEGAYEADDVYVGEYNIDGQNFDYIRLISFRADGSYFYLSNPSSAGASDTQAGLRLQPLESVPLVLGAQATLPTGSSRLKSSIDRDAGVGASAGTGDGVVRLGLRADYGWRGLRPGVSGFLDFSPGVTESINYLYGPQTYRYSLTRGDVMQGGVGITIPWNVLGRDGAVVLEAIGRSENAARYTVDGIDLAPYYSKIERPFLSAQTGIQFIRDDTLELAVDALQDLPGGFETGGRLSYRSGQLGDQLSLSGRLVY